MQFRGSPEKSNSSRAFPFRANLPFVNRARVRHVYCLFMKESRSCDGCSVSSTAVISRFDGIVIILFESKLIYREASVKFRAANLPDS